MVGKRWGEYPVTIGYVAVLWLLGVATSSVLTGPGEAVSSAVRLSVGSLSGNPWGLVASLWWAGNAGAYVLGTVLVVLVGVVFERRMGSWRFLGAAVMSHVVGALLTIGFARATSAVVGDWSAALVSESFLGPTALACGAAAAGSALLGTLWRRRVRVGLFVLVVLLALYGGSFQDVLNFFAALTGAVLGPLLVGRRARPERFAVSRREARVLVALLVAACAVGPVLASLNAHAVGPLAVLRYLYTEIQPTDPATVQVLCADPAQAEDCASATLQLRAGVGAVFMAVLPSFLLVILADGLRRGRRFAWWAALLVQVGTTALAVADALPLIFATPGPAGVNPYEAGSVHGALSLVLPMIVPVTVIVVLAGTRSLFGVSAPSGTYRRFFTVMLGTACVLGVVYVGVGSLIRGGFTPSPGVPQLIADLPDRFFPVSQILERVPAFTPQDLPAIILYEGVGVVFWLVTAVLLVLSFLRPAHHRTGTDEDRARELLHAHGGSTMAWMTTWPGNSYWFSSSGNAFVAFRVLFGVALTLGEPVGPRKELHRTVEEFTVFCSTNGWTPCLYSVGDPVKDVTSDLGWNSVQVAEETLLPLGQIAFTGKKFQDIRTALNRAAKEGIRAEWVSYPSAPLSVIDQINAISEEWVADKGMPEMGFTLGSLDQVDDPEVRCLIAIDEDHTVHAVTSWLPVYQDGMITGWTLDFMRRRGTGFRASIEFLIASAALTLEKEGYRFISLSGAPLARIDHPIRPAVDPSPASTAAGGAQAGTTQHHNSGSGAGAGPDGQQPVPRVLDKLLSGLGASLEPVYGFRSLLAFKAKFQPQYVALHMVYPDAAALPAIANALGRAYLPEVSFSQGFNLARKVLVRGK